MWQKMLDSEMGGKFIDVVLKHKKRFFVVLICILVVYVFLSLLSYSSTDPAWSNFSTYQDQGVRNIGGSGGAWLADVMYMFFGKLSWLFFLWAAIEMYFIFTQSRLVLPLRLLSYAFLWVCTCMLTFGVADMMGANAIGVAGSLGYETFTALAYLIKSVGAFLFATIAILLVGYILLSFIYEGRVQFLDVWKRPAKPTSHNKSDVSPNFDVSNNAPLHKEGGKEAVFDHDKMLENFLKNSITQEELSRLEHLPLMNGQAAHQKPTIPSKPVVSSPIARQPNPEQTQEQGQKQPAHQDKLIQQELPIEPKLPQAEPVVDKSVQPQQPKTQTLTDHEPKEVVGFFMHNPQSLKSALSSMQLSGASTNRRYDDPYTSSIVRTSKAQEPAPTAELPVSEPVEEVVSTRKRRYDLVPDDDVQPSQSVLEQETQASTTPTFQMTAEPERAMVTEPVSSTNLDTNAQTDAAYEPAIQTTQEIVNKPDIVNSQNVASAHQDAMTAPVANHEPTQTLKKPDVQDDNRFKNSSYAMSVAQHRKNLPAVPSMDLLDPHPVHSMGYSQTELVQLAELLEIKLREFGVNAVVMNVLQGPVITNFEVELAAGIKASKVTGIAQDLARSLSVGSVRVVEVIAGKPYIGIEIPNKTRQTIRLIELLDTPQYKDSKGHITTAVGKDSTGEVVMTDLYTAPHMLVAGATRSGKSVLVNGMLLSMLLKYTPDELRFVMIDPKLLELAIYDDIPHLLTPVITDMNDSMAALSWCVEEMERRYRIMNSVKVRQISEFNKKVKEAEARGEPLYDSTWQPNDSVSQDRPPKLKPMPFIVVVVDEYADLVSQVKQVEGLIDALARKSRASGIHIILATQRPSVDVITGVIKANIPARIALSVRQKVDSRTILDTAGAETLLGNGDMLFIGNNSNDPVRVHGAYVSDAEVDRVCQAWRERGVPEYVDMDAGLDYSQEAARAVDGLDALYNDALSFVLESGVTSISAVQRHLSIGYNRAAKILDSMEAQGVLSPLDHTNKRKILKQ